MKTEHTMGMAFILNMAFSVFELAGGLITGSAAILSDAVHDFGDALGIGLSYWLEKTSRKQADEHYTFGYGRYTVLGGVITSLVLLLGSVAAICHAVSKLCMPTVLHYDGMLIIAVIGLCVNGCAALLTHRGESLNQKAVFWHLLEDVLGWAVVLIGALIMRVTEWAWLDPVLSIAVALFVGIHAIEHLKEGLAIFLEKAPSGLETSELHTRLIAVEGVVCVRALRVWSVDGVQHCAAVHLEIIGESAAVKDAVRMILESLGIVFCMIETTIAENVR